MKSEVSFFRLYFGILVHPKKTIQLILNNDPDHFVWPIVFTFSILASFNSTTFITLFDFLPTPLALLSEVILNASVNIFGFLIISWFIYLLGKLIGGKGSYKEIKAAFAWGWYPPAFIGAILFLVGEIPNWIRFLHGETNITALITEPKMDGGNPLLAMSLLIMFWCLLLSFSNIAVAHKFNGWQPLIIISLLFGFVTVFIGGVYFYFQHKQMEEVAQEEYKQGEALFNQKKYQEAMWTYQGVEVLSKKFNNNLLNSAEKKEWVCRAYLNDWRPSEGPRSADVRQTYPEIYTKYKTKLIQITPVP